MLCIKLELALDFYMSVWSRLRVTPTSLETNYMYVWHGQVLRRWLIDKMEVDGVWRQTCVSNMVTRLVSRALQRSVAW